MLNDFLVGLQFLTRINLVRQTDWSLDSFGRSVKYFPLIGAVIGCILGAFTWAFGAYLPKHLLAAVLITLEIVLTGALHCDGLMDTIDGVFSGRSRERMLEIMKDSRVGAFGVVGFICFTLVKWSIYQDLESFALLQVLFIAPVLGRMAMVYGITRFPYARKDGMGKAFHDYAGTKTFYIALFFTLCLILPWGKQAIIGFIFTVLFAQVFAAYLVSKLEGLTGDCYGAMTALTELLVCIVYVLV